MPEGERKLAAIMFTDMVGYTALGQRNEYLSLALVEEQRKLVRPVLARHSGREVKTIGDAFLVEFPSALEAVRCAYDVQRTIREYNFSLNMDRRIHLRVGIHLGDVVEMQGDISGDAVNVASRIEALAEDGGVCLSQQVYDHVKNKFELTFESLGPKALKNVAEPLEVYKLIMPWEGAKNAPTKVQQDRNRIAILPFVNMSPDPNDGFFADGLTEELISTTSSITGLTLIARTSVMSYKGSTKKVGEIGKELNAGTVLEGSVRKAGNKVRITVQLINAQSEGHLWSQSYDRDFDDIFAVQSDIARQVADALRVQMLPNETRQIEKRPTRSSEAYTLYLKGRYYWNERNKESLLRAVEYFKRAAEIDPDYASAYCGLSDCYAVLGDNLHIPYDEAFPISKEYALRAVNLDDSLAEAHASLADRLADIYEYEIAEREFKKAIQLNPSYATGHQWYGLFLARTGKLEESLREALLAQQLDPASPIVNVFCGGVFALMKKYDLAEKQVRRALDLEPGFIGGHLELSWIYLQWGKSDEAEREVKEVLRLTNNQPLGRAYLAVVYAYAGKNLEATKILDELSNTRRYSYVPNKPLVAAYLRLGDNDKAVELIQKEFEGHANWLTELAFDPTYSSLRSDPRVIGILRKIGPGSQISDVS